MSKGTLAAKEMIINRTDDELLSDWTELDKKSITPDVALVRGWLIDEIKKRWPAEFANWLDNYSDDNNIEHYINLSRKVGV